MARLLCGTCQLLITSDHIAFSIKVDKETVAEKTLTKTRRPAFTEVNVALLTNI